MRHLPTSITAMLFCLIVACGSDDSGDSKSCSPACAAGFACVDGTCVSNGTGCQPACQTGFSCVNSQCVQDTTGCSPACTAGFECSNGQCVETPCTAECGQGFVCFQDQCVLESTMCNPPCDAGTTCKAGQCIPTTADCDPACTEGFECVNGQCVAVAVDCNPACTAGFECINGQCTPAAAGAMVINEFLVTPTDQEVIELYNGTQAPVTLSGWTLHVQTGQESTWNLPAQQLAPGQFLLLNAVNLVPVEAGDSVLPNAGATVWLTDASGAIVDSVSYGTDGSAPTPIYATSTARAADGMDSDDDAQDFNWDPTPTLGSANDVGSVALGSSPVKLSELFWVSGDDTADFIELYVASDTALDVSGWTLVFSGSGTGDDLVFNNGTTVPPGYWVLEEASFPEYAKLKDSGVLYLFDNAGARVYQMGWSGLTNDGTTSLGYLPGENGAPDCFDGPTCGLSSLTPTKGATNKL